MSETSDSGWDEPGANGEAEDGAEPDDTASPAAASSDAQEDGAPADEDDEGDEGAEGDDRARQALDFVTEVVLHMGMECRVRLRAPGETSSPEEIHLEISGRDAGRIIGKKGQALQALQFLVHRVVNRPPLPRRHVLVDAEGYRSRRDASLANMAKRLGKQAVSEGKIITFEPMSPRDRRVVHLALAKFEGVITKSDGEGEDRRVQIIPVRRPSLPSPG